MLLSDFYTPIIIEGKQFSGEIVQVEKEVKQYRENGVIKRCKERLMKSTVQVNGRLPALREPHHFRRYFKQRSLLFDGHQTHGFTQQPTFQRDPKLDDIRRCFVVPW